MILGANCAMKFCPPLIFLLCLLKDQVTRIVSEIQLPTLVPATKAVLSFLFKEIKCKQQQWSGLRTCTQISIQLSTLFPFVCLAFDLLNGTKTVSIYIF